MCACLNDSDVQVRIAAAAALGKLAREDDEMAIGDCGLSAAAWQLLQPLIEDD